MLKWWWLWFLRHKNAYMNLIAIWPNILDFITFDIFNTIRLQQSRWLMSAVLVSAILWHMSSMSTVAHVNSFTCAHMRKYVSWYYMAHIWLLHTYQQIYIYETGRWRLWRRRKQKKRNAAEHKLVEHSVFNNLATRNEIHKFQFCSISFHFIPRWFVLFQFRVFCVCVIFVAELKIKAESGRISFGGMSQYF